MRWVKTVNTFTQSSNQLGMLTIGLTFFRGIRVREISAKVLQY